MRCRRSRHSGAPSLCWSIASVLSPVCRWLRSTGSAWRRRCARSERPPRMRDPTRRLAAELGGTAFLLMTVVGSGIMGQRLSGGNEAVALLANSLATGAGLYALITVLPAANFNPAVTLLALW